MNAVFAGTFDPFTLGHYDIVKRAALLFDEVTVGVAIAHGREQALSVDGRVHIAQQSVADIPNVSVRKFSGFLTDFARSCGANVIVRGQRSGADFEYERTLFEVYKGLDKNIECVYLMSGREFTHVSSSIVRQLLKLGGAVGNYVHSNALKTIKDFYGVK